MPITEGWYTNHKSVLHIFSAIGKTEVINKYQLHDVYSRGIKNENAGNMISSRKIYEWNEPSRNIKFKTKKQLQN